MSVCVGRMKALLQAEAVACGLELANVPECGPAPYCFSSFAAKFSLLWFFCGLLVTLKKTTCPETGTYTFSLSLKGRNVIKSAW